MTKSLAAQDWRKNKKHSLVLFLKLFLENPVQAVRYLPKFLSGEFTEPGYVLNICGPQLLRKVAELCRLNGVEPILLFGTLRGFILTKNILPRSEDLDFGFLEGNFPKIGFLKEPFLKMGFEIVFDNEYQLQFRSLKFHSLLIDLWRIYERNDQMVIGTTYQKETGELVDKTLILNYFAKDLFKDFATVEFLDCQVSIPKKAEEVLRVHYGPQWERQDRSFEYYDRLNWKFEVLD